MQKTDNDVVKKDFDANLLGRLAGSLEDQSVLLRTLQETAATNSKESSSNSTKLDSAHARLGKLEHTINGNGDPGIKTRLALAERDANSMGTRLKEMEDWKSSLSNQQIQELKDDKKTGSASRLSSLLVVIALLLSAISLIPTCGPLAYKAFKSSSK